MKTENCNFSLFFLWFKNLFNNIFLYLEPGQDFVCVCLCLTRLKYLTLFFQYHVSWKKNRQKLKERPGWEEVSMTCQIKFIWRLISFDFKNGINIQGFVFVF